MSKQPEMQMAAAQPAPVEGPEMLPDVAAAPAPPVGRNAQPEQKVLHVAVPPKGPAPAPANDLSNVLENQKIEPPAEKVEPITVTADINWNGEHVAVIRRERPPVAPKMETASAASVLTPIPDPVPEPVSRTVSKPSPEKVMEILRKEPFSATAPTPITYVPETPPGTGEKDGKILEGQPVLWRAREGEEIRRVLSQWSQIAGYKFEWQSDRSGMVQKDFSYEGSFEDAVARLMGESGKTSGISAQIAGKDGMELTRNAVLPQPHNYSSGKWHAIRGTDMRNILQLWAREAGVELLWKSDVNFPVKQTVNMTGSFESALQTMLGQYEGDGLRPVGVLHKDPVSPRTYLVIEANRSS
jgi:hypothetical protein